MCGKLKVFSITVISLLLLISISLSSFAVFPEKIIEVIVPWSPGGNSDLTARVVAKHFNKYSPQPMVVVNITGGSGTTGRREVKNAKPDGYKIGIHNKEVHTTKFSGLVDWGYEAFTPILGIGNCINVLVCSINAPWNNMQELAEDAKRNPGKYSYNATPGGSSHFGLLMIEDALGIELNMVTSGGQAERRAEVYGGHIDLTDLDVATAIPYIESGDFKALGVWQTDNPEERNPFIPDVQTYEEQGVKSDWNLFGYYGPKGLPEEVIQTYEDIFKKIVQDEEFQEDFRKAYKVLNFVEQDEYISFLENEAKVVEKLAEKGGF